MGDSRSPKRLRLLHGSFPVLSASAVTNGARVVSGRARAPDGCGWTGPAGATAEAYGLARVWSAEEAEADDVSQGFALPPARLPPLRDALPPVSELDSQLAGALARLAGARRA